MKIVSWNMAHRAESWHYLLASGADIAMLQEAAEPPADIAHDIELDSVRWETGGAGARRLWRTAVVKLSKNIALQWYRPQAIDAAEYGELAVSRTGTLAAASLHLPPGEELTLISIYGAWESPAGSTGSNWIYADASVHRVISDLCFFIGQQNRHRIIVAGDLNILYGYGEKGSPYWASRYRTVFDRFSALGLEFVGPQAPNGRLAEPWPEHELPRSSRNVLTFYHSQQTPATATRQMDFVFAPQALCDRMQVRALNDPALWGPGDHCLVEIEID